VSDPTPTGDDEWIAETARGLIVKFRDAGYMRVGTPQTAINDVAATLREAIARGGCREREVCAKVAELKFIERRVGKGTSVYTYSGSVQYAIRARGEVK